MFLNLNQNGIGVDISEQSLRLVELKKPGKKIIISTFNDVKLKEGVIKEGKILKPETLKKSLNQLLKTAQGGKLKTKSMITALPEPKTFIKLIDVPLTEENDDISDLIKEEIKNHIPFNLDEIYLDWQIIKKYKEHTKVLIGAAPKNIVDNCTNAIEESEMLPFILEIEAAPIIRSLIDPNDQKPKIIIDLGAVRTSLIIYTKSSVQFTVSLPISGTKITETISKSLDLDIEKAEKAKIVCGLDENKCEGALIKILMKTIDELVSHINKAITFYKANFDSESEISELILCGGGANFSKIDEVLSNKLDIPVKIGNPLTNVSQIGKNKIPKEKLLSYTTAIGLALRNFQKKRKIK